MKFHLVRIFLETINSIYLATCYRRTLENQKGPPAPFHTLDLQIYR